MIKFFRGKSILGELASSFTYGYMLAGLYLHKISFVQSKKIIIKDLCFNRLLHASFFVYIPTKLLK